MSTAVLRHRNRVKILVMADCPKRDAARANIGSGGLNGVQQGLAVAVIEPAGNGAVGAPGNLNEVPVISLINLAHGCQVEKAVAAIVLNDELATVRRQHQGQGPAGRRPKAEVRPAVCGSGYLHPGREGLALLDVCSRVIAIHPTGGIGDIETVAAVVGGIACSSGGDIPAARNAV